MERCLEEKSVTDSISILNKPRRFLRRGVQRDKLLPAVELIKSIEDFYLLLQGQRTVYNVPNINEARNDYGKFIEFFESGNVSVPENHVEGDTKPYIKTIFNEYLQVLTRPNNGKSAARRSELANFLRFHESYPHNKVPNLQRYGIPETIIYPGE